MSKSFSNPSLYFMQTKLASPGTQGNSRWTVVEPHSSSLYGAVGKDEYPRLIEIIKNASSRDGVTISGVDILFHKKILLAEPGVDNKSTGNYFLNFYHDFVHSYEFHNYESVERFKKDREQMAEYGKISPHPNVYTERSAELPRHALPLPKMNLSSVDDEAQLLSNVLSGTFLAVGLIPGGDFGPWLRKANPSGGGRHPVEAMVIARGIEGMPDGDYYFDAPNCQLILKRGLEGGGYHKRLSILITARVERPMWRYRESRSFRAVFLDAGHCIETLTQLVSAYGWFIVERTVGDAEFGELDLQDIPICAFDILKDLAKRSEDTDDRSKVGAEVEVLSTTFDTQYNTNPFFWGYFCNAELVGAISYPRANKFNLSIPMFNALNYAQMSKRGDRPSTVSDISQAQQVSEETVKELVELGFLLPKDSVRELYARSHEWINHGWYQNLLMYLEYRSEKLSSNFLIGPKLFSITNRPDSVSLWHSLSSHRKTTRFFSPELIDINVSISILSSALEFLTELRRVDLFHLRKADQDLYTVNKWDDVRNEFVFYKRVERSQVEMAAIGQQPIVHASDVYWFAASIKGAGPVEYVNILLRLGMLMQKVCICCANMELGVFVTPATNDLLAAEVSDLDSRYTINYFAAIGRDASNKL